MEFIRADIVSLLGLDFGDDSVDVDKLKRRFKGANDRLAELYNKSYGLILLRRCPSRMRSTQ